MIRCRFPVGPGSVHWAGRAPALHACAYSCCFCWRSSHWVTLPLTLAINPNPNPNEKASDARTVVGQYGIGRRRAHLL